MPWASKAQQGWGNSLSGKEAMGQKAVDEFNAASKGKKNLPEHVKKPARKQTTPFDLGTPSNNGL